MPQKNYLSRRGAYWLEWDGSYTLAGTCNAAAHALATGVKAPTPVIPPLPNGTIPVMVTNPRHVSVRLERVVDHFDPATDHVRIPVTLKNPNKVRSMLLRVYDRDEVVRYQEVIAQKPHLHLAPVSVPDLLTLRNAHAPVGAIGTVAHAHPVPPARSYAGGSPYRIEVWVSNQANAFAGVNAATNMGALVHYPDTVHNQYRPTVAEHQAKAKANEKAKSPVKKFFTLATDAIARVQESKDREQRADVRALGGRYAARKVCSAGGRLRLRVAGHGASTSDTVDQWDATLGQTWAQRVDDLFDGIDQADATMNLVEDSPDELRVYVAPEWYFRAPIAGACLSHADLLAIVQAIQVRSNQPKYARWLILPGTIYFGLGYDWSAPPTAVNLQNDILTHLRDAFLPVGAPPPRPHPVNSTRWFVANMAVAVMNGNLLHWQTKLNRNDALKADQRWAMFELPVAQRLLAHRGSHFTAAGLRIAVDICMDHDLATAARQYFNLNTAAQQPVDLHVIMSYGVTRRSYATIARDGGYLLHCEGQQTFVQMRRVCVSDTAVPPAASVHVAADNDPLGVRALWDQHALFDRAYKAADGLYELRGELDAANQAVTNREGVLGIGPGAVHPDPQLATLRGTAATLQAQWNNDHPAFTGWAEWNPGQLNAVPAVATAYGALAPTVASYGNLMMALGGAAGARKDQIRQLGDPRVKGYPFVANQAQVTHPNNPAKVTVLRSVDLDAQPPTQNDRTSAVNVN